MVVCDSPQPYDPPAQHSADGSRRTVLSHSCIRDPERPGERVGDPVAITARTAVLPNSASMYRLTRADRYTRSARGRGRGVLRF